MVDDRIDESTPASGYTVGDKYREREVVMGPGAKNGPSHPYKPKHYVPQLRPEHISPDAKLYANRVEYLYDMSQGAICAEMGVYEGLFSLSILDIMNPRELHLFDINTKPIMKSVRADSRVRIKQGDSSGTMGVYQDDYFDFIYIDGDHSFRGALADAEVAVKKIKPGGVIAFNDYVNWSFYEAVEYGVKPVANTLCLDFGFKVIGHAYMHDGYDDIVLRAPLND